MLGTSESHLQHPGRETAFLAGALSEGRLRMGALEVSTAQVVGTRRWTGCYHSFSRGLGSTAPCLFPLCDTSLAAGRCYGAEPKTV